MNKIFTTIINTIFFSSMAFAQLTEFSQGDILSAGSMNQNFKYLESKLGGINETTVNCGTDGNGHGIKDAIQKGFNSIVINGICKENIKLDGREGNVPRLLKLRGANNDYTKDKIIDNSSYTENLIAFKYSGLLVTIDNLTLSGGDLGINSNINNIIFIYNSKVDDYKKWGINIQGDSILRVENLIIDGSHNDENMNEIGLRVSQNSLVTLKNITIKNNKKYGISLSLSNITSHASGKIILENNSRGIHIVKYGSFTAMGNLSITGSSDRAFLISQGHLKAINLTMNISECSGNIFSAIQSIVEIDQLTAKGYGSSNESLISVNQSNAIFRNMDLSNSENDAIESDQSIIYIDNLSAYNNKGDGIDAFRTNLTVKNSTIKDNEGQGIALHNVSNLKFDSSIISSNKGISIYASRNSFFDLRGASKITSNTKEAIKIDHNGSGRIQNGVIVSSSASNNGWGVWIRKGGYIEINSDSTVSGNSGSLKGELGTKIDLEYGANVQSIECGDDNQSMVILNSSNGNYPTPSVGSNCISVKY